MAITVPSQDLPGVQSRALPAPQIRGVAPDQSGLQLQQTVMNVAGQLASQEAERADNAALLDAEAQLSQTKLDLMFNPDGGVYNRKGKDALDITNQTLPTFDKQAELIGQGLSTQRQKDRFALMVNNQRQGLNGELNRYEYAQRNAYYDQVDETNVATSLEGAVKYADDPAQVAHYQSKGAFIIGESGIRKGLPPETILDEQRKFNSAVSYSVIQQVITTDPLKAQQIYAKNADSMTAEDQIKAQKLLGTSVRQQMGAEIGSRLWKDGDGGGAGLVNAIIQAESGGDQSAVSPKGATGTMQLMPETAMETSKELGIPFSLERLSKDPQYNVALGTAYLNKLLGRFDGNQTLAVAAYNAGPSMVEDWLKGTNSTGKNPGKKQLPDPRSSPESAAAFIQAIPFEETRNYTVGIMQKAAPTIPASTKYAAGVSWITDNIKDPALKKFAMDDLDDRKKAAEAQINSLYDQAAKVVLDGGFSKIPAQLLNNLPADEVLKLQRMDEHQRKGTDPKTDYTKLETFLSMPPEKLASLSLAKDLQPYLSRSDLGRVTTAWEAAKRGDMTPQKVEAGKEKVINRAMSLASIVVGESKAAMKPDNLKKQAQFRSALDDLTSSFKLKEGREPNVEETESLANKLLIKAVLPGKGVFGSDKEQTLYEINPQDRENSYIDSGTIEVNEIPAADRLTIIRRLRVDGVQPSEANIKERYKISLSKLGMDIK